jgi:hypothetical protein
VRSCDLGKLHIAPSVIYARTPIKGRSLTSNVRFLRNFAMSSSEPKKRLASPYPTIGGILRHCPRITGFWHGDFVGSGMPYLVSSRTET